MTKTVLIVEDEPDIREVAAASLELSTDWRILAAASGAEGIRVAHAEAPDAILLDVMMPDLDGPATLERLRAEAATSNIPVVFLTAKQQSTEIARFTELGARAVIAKPFDPMTLADQLAQALGW